MRRCHVCEKFIVQHSNVDSSFLAESQQFLIEVWCWRDLGSMKNECTAELSPNILSIPPFHINKNTQWTHHHFKHIYASIYPGRFILIPLTKPFLLQHLAGFVILVSSETYDFCQKACFPQNYSALFFIREQSFGLACVWREEDFSHT